MDGSRHQFRYTGKPGLDFLNPRFSLARRIPLSGRRRLESAGSFSQIRVQSRPFALSAVRQTGSSFSLNLIAAVLPQVTRRIDDSFYPQVLGEADAVRIHVKADDLPIASSVNYDGMVSLIRTRELLKPGEKLTPRIRIRASFLLAVSPPSQTR